MGTKIMKFGVLLLLLLFCDAKHHPKTFLRSRPAVPAQHQ